MKQYTYATGPGPDRIPIVVEPASRSSRRERTTERDRDYRSSEKARPDFFGEHGAGTVNPRYNQPTSYAHGDVNFSPAITPDNIQYSSSRRDRRDDFAKPAFTRSSTVY